ncbi:hypothetical protein V8C86DRAFT_2868516 [Haematococcus lacustris]
MRTKQLAPFHVHSLPCKPVLVTTCRPCVSCNAASFASPCSSLTNPLPGTLAPSQPVAHSRWRRHHRSSTCSPHDQVGVPTRLGQALAALPACRLASHQSSSSPTAPFTLALELRRAVMPGARAGAGAGVGAGAGAGLVVVAGAEPGLRWRPAKGVARGQPHALPSRGSHPPALRAVGAGSRAQPTKLLGGWDAPRLVDMFVRMGSAGKAPDPEWLDMFLAASSTILHEFSLAHIARLLYATAELSLLGAEPEGEGEGEGEGPRRPAMGLPEYQQPVSEWVDDLTKAAEVQFSSGSGEDIIALCAGMMACGRPPPSPAWTAAALTQVAARAEELSADACARAILLAPWLLDPPRDVTDPPPTSGHTPHPSAAKGQGGGSMPRLPVFESDQAGGRGGGGAADPVWLDIMTNRMAVCELDGLDAEEVADVAYCLAVRHQYIPPLAWLQAFKPKTSRAILPPDTAACLLISLAAFQLLPDLFTVQQAWVLTYGDLPQLAPELLVDLAWALGCWQSGKGGSPAQDLDFRPPLRWWEEWFRSCEESLAELRPQQSIKLVWALAYCRLVPPRPWLLRLLTTCLRQVQTGAFTPLELLYLSRAADRVLGMLASATGVVPEFDPDAQGDEEAQMAQWEEMRAGMCGEDAYDPPPELPGLVQLSLVALSKGDLPRGWERINMAWPPYALPEQEERQSAE